MRIVSATHRDLEDGVRDGVFRADLLFRLNAVRLALPPLRERGRDVLMLAEHFLARAARGCEAAPPRISASLEARLLSHSWPGNVRELANGCAYAVRVAGARETVEIAHWPTTPFGVAPPRSRGLHAETQALEERRLREALDRSHGNKSRAARSLGLSRQGLLKKLRRYGLWNGEAIEAPAGEAGG